MAESSSSRGSNQPEPTFGKIVSEMEILNNTLHLMEEDLPTHNSAGVSASKTVSENLELIHNNTSASVSNDTLQQSPVATTDFSIDTSQIDIAEEVLKDNSVLLHPSNLIPSVSTRPARSRKLPQRFTNYQEEVYMQPPPGFSHEKPDSKNPNIKPHLSPQQIATLGEAGGVIRICVTDVRTNHFVNVKLMRGLLPELGYFLSGKGIAEMINNNIFIADSEVYFGWHHAALHVFRDY
ncbi:hypothetical protein V6N11_061974 [Hibiscus sabdariffa]|uniref:Uncharacterized protein n=1 Tax=Hibiscus sabdariffa TaxID=183260 RepID=A0ABR2PRZ2_9ROSI